MEITESILSDDSFSWKESRKWPPIRSLWCRFFFGQHDVVVFGMKTRRRIAFRCVRGRWTDKATSLVSSTSCGGKETEPAPTATRCIINHSVFFPFSSWWLSWLKDVCRRESGRTQFSAAVTGFYRVLFGFIEFPYSSSVLPGFNLLLLGFNKLLLG